MFREFLPIVVIPLPPDTVRDVKSEIEPCIGVCGKVRPKESYRKISLNMS